MRRASFPPAESRAPLWRLTSQAAFESRPITRGASPDIERRQQLSRALDSSTNQMHFFFAVLQFLPEGQQLPLLKF